VTGPPGPLEYGPLVGAAYLGSSVQAFRDRPRSLSGLLAAAARRWPQRAAVVAPAGSRTFAELERAADAAADAEVLLQDEDDPVVALPTSGTTGVPKTTLVTSRSLIHAALAYSVLLGLGTDRRTGEASPERTLAVLPLHSIGSLSAQTTAMALVGGTCVLPADTSPAAARRPLAEHAVTHLDAVPAWLSLYARLPDRAPLPALRTIIYGGAPMPVGTAAALARDHSGSALYDVRGLSETHGHATALRLDPATPGSVGRAVAGVEVRAGGAGPGGVGELEVRGANVSPGYLDDPGTSAAVLRDGWLRTGDVGAVAADGSVRILGRAKDVILRGGASVFSVEVEQVLSGAPGVAEAAVYAVADPIGGEAVAAAVVLRSGAVLDAGELRRLVRAEVGGHAVPRHVAAVEALPRNLTGKIDKRRLREERP